MSFESLMRSRRASRATISDGGSEIASFAPPDSREHPGSRKVQATAAAKAVRESIRFTDRSPGRSFGGSLRAACKTGGQASDIVCHSVNGASFGGAFFDANTTSRKDGRARFGAGIRLHGPRRLVRRA